MKSNLSFKIKKPNQRRAVFTTNQEEFLRVCDEDMDRYRDIELSDNDWMWCYSPAIPEWGYSDHKLIKITPQEAVAIVAHRALTATRQDKLILEKAKKILHKFDMSRLWLRVESDYTISWDSYCSEYGISIENKSKKLKERYAELNKIVMLEIASIENSRSYNTKKIKSSRSKGTKIATAFSKVPHIPTNIDEFATLNDISIAVLKQRKRFDPYPDKGNVQVRKDKKTGETMIWRESPSK